MHEMHVRKLNDSQLEEFNVEYVNEQRWGYIKACLDRDFGDGKFNFVDIGGGNGLFADKILHEYPNCTGTVLDYSELLLSQNSENSRKRIICDSVENLAGYKEEKGCYDVVFFNWLLHHLVGDSYSETIKNIKSCISESKHLLSARGRISIFENNYDGILIDTLPSYMVFQLTSMKAIAPITRKLGANTAGVGVCFLSRKSWEQVIQDSGLSLQDYSEELKRTIPFHRKLLLHLRDLNIGHYWCGVNK